MKFLHCTNEKRRASPGNEKISLDARNERRGEVEGSRSVKLLELPSAWKLSTPSVGKRTKMQRSSSPTLIPHPPSRLLALSPPLSCDAVESIYRDSPLLPRQLLVLFSPATLCIEEGGGTLSGSSSPTAESLGLGSEKEDLIKAERNEPGKTTGVHLSRSRRSGLLFLRSFFYLAISPVSTVSPNNRPVPNRLPAPTASSISTLISSDRYISKAETLSWNGMTPYTYTKRRTRPVVSSVVFSRAGNPVIKGGNKVEEITITRGGGVSFRNRRERDPKRIQSDSPLCTGSVTLLRTVLIPLSRKRSERARMG